MWAMPLGVKALGTLPLESDTANNNTTCMSLTTCLCFLCVCVPTQGIVVNGLIRDSQAMSGMPLGVKALGTLPLTSDKAAADQGTQALGTLPCLPSPNRNIATISDHNSPTPTYLCSCRYLSVHTHGIVVNGLIRDSQAMSGMSLGVKALGTLPLKSDKAAAEHHMYTI
jgi:hypothetical protein